jgi:hypothetical protein
VRQVVLDPHRSPKKTARSSRLGSLLDGAALSTPEIRGADPTREKARREKELRLRGERRDLQGRAKTCAGSEVTLRVERGDHPAGRTPTTLDERRD